MSVIQKIQDKYAKLMAIIIALALMIFVVMLAFENGGTLFGGGNSTTIGKVNGTTIDYTDFMKKVDQQEKTMEARGYGSGAELQQRAIDAVWSDEVNEILQNKELKKLGIKVGKKEMGDVLYGPNGPEDLKKLFTDTATGIYNGQMAKQQIDAAIKIKKGNADQIAQKNQLIAFINYQESARLRDKYNSLMSNSVNYARWFIEKQIADNSQLARISLVRDNYAANADSTIKVSDKEIQDYLDKHKEDYKQKEESRSIAYAAFSTQPSAADSAAAKEKADELKPQLDTVTDVKKFVEAQDARFYDSYLSGTAIQIPVKDSIFKLPVGGVYGPYLDGSSYSLARLLGVRDLPDTVKVRHILIATTKQDPQTGQPYEVRDTVTAKKLIDSIQTALKNGAKFDSLVKLSDDNPDAEQPPGKLKGGIYDKVTSGRMVPEFNDFIFGHPVGSKGVVKTEFGYHYVEILSQKGNSKAYKIAYLSKPIETSNETDANANNMASQFAGDSRDQKSFDANAEKLLKEKKINKSVAGDIIPSSYSIGGLGQSRSLIKKIYNAKLGEVLEPEKVGNNWVVAIVTEIIEEGTMTLAKARMEIEPVLRNKKIADKLKKKIGTITTLEAAATALGGKPIEIIDSLRMLGAQTGKAMAIGSEAKVIGSAFNLANSGKMIPEVIEGSSGIYVVRIDNVTATSVGSANVAEQRKARYQDAKSQGMMYQKKTTIQVLREAATIKDYRIKFL
jgi:peptidyl-prolyl cis-trans isomerase D